MSRLWTSVGVDLATHAMVSVVARLTLQLLVMCVMTSVTGFTVSVSYIVVMRKNVLLTTRTCPSLNWLERNLVAVVLTMVLSTTEETMRFLTRASSLHSVCRNLTVLETEMALQLHSNLVRFVSKASLNTHPFDLWACTVAFKGPGRPEVA